MIELHKLLKNTHDLWSQVDALEIHFPVMEEAKRLENEAYFDKMIQQMKQQQDIYKLLDSNVLFDLSFMKETDKKAFFESTKQFIADAKAFDDEISDADIFQALRNVWIVLMLQVAFELPVRYHKAIFAYSMLYPYSDNYIDAEDVSHHEQKMFNAWFTKRLHGIAVHGNNPRKQHIIKLIKEIETIYPRDIYPDVWESLYAIQEAQIRSSHQKQNHDEAFICEISIEKGGTSVLADGYLIQGMMSEEQKQFCMDFGFALQLADDIQDIVEDHAMCHSTLATMLKDGLMRKQLFLKSCDMLQLAIKRYRLIPEHVAAFIVQNCEMMMVNAVYANAKLFPKEWMNEIEKALPVRNTYMKKLNHMIRGISLEQVL